MKKSKINYAKIITILVLLAYIISPVDFMPLIEIDDGFAGILIGRLLND